MSEMSPTLNSLVLAPIWSPAFSRQLRISWVPHAPLNRADPLDVFITMPPLRKSHSLWRSFAEHLGSRQEFRWIPSNT